jgi:hypothetical protein
MRATYVCTRLLALFHAYDALPGQHEFINATMVPMVRIDILCWLAQALSCGNWHEAHQLNYEVRETFMDRIARREFVEVLDFKIEFPEKNSWDIRITYQLMRAPHQLQIIDLPLSQRINEAEAHRMYDQAYRRIQAATQAALKV